MTRHLLDANVLIALVITEHVHHDRASRWFRGAGSAAVSPIVEGALVRYLVRIGVSAASASRLLTALRDDGRIELWPDDLSYADADLTQVIGHRQVTDAYLVSLARLHGGLLATLDEALAQASPQATALLPE